MGESVAARPKPPTTNRWIGAERTRAGLLRPLISGAVAVFAAIGASELVSGILGGPSLLAGIGEWVINHQPPGAKDFVVGLFGTNDKLALETLIVIVAALIGMALGWIAVRWSLPVASGGFIVFAALGFLASIGSPAASPSTAMLVAVAAAIAGIATLQFLLNTAHAARAAGGAPALAAGPNWSRRGFLIQAGAITAASTVVGVIGRRLLEGGGFGSALTTTGAAPVTLPSPAVTAALPAGASIDQPGITPIVVPNEDFYRIDTALIVPSVDASTWQLTVKGMVDKEVTLTYHDLAEMPLFEQYVTIACVSNEVGGNLVGNTKWTGVKLRDVLAMAGVQPGATQLVGRSVDGWTSGMPTAWVMDPSREPMIALEMNGQPLPRNHGYPARLIVPGLYGYVSATKWLAELELTTLEAFDAYWVPLGWAKEGPILTQSRIDVPGNGDHVTPGRVAVAGVAWAPDRGVTKVEISVDNGPWAAAQLSAPISKATWVQWLYAWDATAVGSGLHTIAVRATDGTGAVQTDQQTPPAPDGARGHHTIEVLVA
jgi:DMSO/TMAO reductase YedYZ molybdopterin-dependent catalytic subunit